MDFDFLTQQAALVQKKKKYATFTIKDIGGPEEIKKWREQQAAKETVYRMRLSARDERVETYEKELGQKLATPRLSKPDWAEKYALAQEEREKISKAVQALVDHPPWKPVTSPKVTVFQRIIRFFGNIWKNANF